MRRVARLADHDPHCHWKRALLERATESVEQVVPASGRGQLAAKASTGVIDQRTGIDRPSASMKMERVQAVVGRVAKPTTWDALDERQRARRLRMGFEECLDLRRIGLPVAGVGLTATRCSLKACRVPDREDGVCRSWQSVRPRRSAG